MLSSLIFFITPPSLFIIFCFIIVWNQSTYCGKTDEWIREIIGLRFLLLFDFRFFNSNNQQPISDTSSHCCPLIIKKGNKSFPSVQSTKYFSSVFDHGEQCVVRSICIGGSPHNERIIEEKWTRNINQCCLHSVFVKRGSKTIQVWWFDWYSCLQSDKGK